jgi:hypothetical protein
MDLGRPNNHSFQNRTKLAPLHPARRTDSDHIIFFANGRRMRKISHSDRFPKHAKSQTGQSQLVILLMSAARHVTSA